MGSIYSEYLHILWGFLGKKGKTMLKSRKINYFYRFSMIFFRSRFQ